ncbi:MAG: triose-phosphate isomerase, partial [Patescibacteria group bacterium]
ERERDGEGRYLGIVREELTLAVESLAPKERAKVIVAYEPLWAIGRDAEHAIGQNDLTEMVLYIRKILAELLPGKSSQHSLVLYGGSVEPTNIRDLAASSGVDGFLIGHASVELHTFSLLVKQLQ